MASERPTTEAGHIVYPGGPPCDPSCPGDWSTYHDGFAWGYEKATTETRSELIDELVAAVENDPRWGGFHEGCIRRSDLLRILEGARHGK